MSWDSFFCLDAEIIRKYSQNIRLIGQLDPGFIVTNYPSHDLPMKDEETSGGKVAKAGRPLSMSDRWKILALYERGHKISHIARQIGVTHSCISKIMSRYRRTGSMCPRSVRPEYKSDSESSDVSSQTTSEVEDSSVPTPRKPPLPYSIERLLA